MPDREEREVQPPAYVDRIAALRRRPRIERNGAPHARGNGNGGAPPEPPPAERRAVVEALNREFALILLGNSAAVLREGMDASGEPEIRLLTMDAFKEWLRPRKLWIEDRAVPYSAIWLNAEERRQFSGLTFDPDERASPDYYNLWRGFTVEPDRRGSCQRFLSHMADNVCRGDPELFAWVMGWFAALFQRPTAKTGTALVLRGPQGAGKTIVGKIIGRLLGEHYVLVGDPRYVTGRFNAHLVNRLLLQLDEATWGGDHEATGKLKDLITGDYQLIEFKGKEPLRVKNYVRLLITSNSDWVVPAGLEERRFAVLDIGEDQMQNSAYFQAIEDEMDSGGAEALLAYLLDYDLSAVNVRQIPHTGALYEQKVASLTPAMSWWVDVLREGSLPGDKHGDGRCPTRQLYESYVLHGQGRGISRRSGETELGMFLTRYVPGLSRRRIAGQTSAANRPWWYEFPPLTDCRASFEKAARSTLDWPDAQASWAPDAHGSG